MEGLRQVTIEFLVRSGFFQHPGRLLRYHPYSMDALAKAMKDPHPKLREEGIEGLKKIKKKNKPGDQNKGKA
ncbi:MAG: hypothetical protein ACOC4M_09480, partial [Promethearchaeia archaeon]